MSAKARSGPRLNIGRLVWLLFVLFYAYNFFRNVFTDAAPERAAIPVLFFYLLSLWMAVEFYFMQPFFQSGLVRGHYGLRIAFAFFFYPVLVFAGFDYAGLHLSSFPLVYPWLNVLGLLVFVAGCVLRILSLSSRSRMYRRIRQPRYFATAIQIVGFPLAFGSLIGLVLSLLVGLPLVFFQARHEDRTRAAQEGEAYRRYQKKTPLLLPFGR